MVPAPAIEPSIDEPMPPSTVTQRDSAVPEQPTEPAAQPMIPSETQGTKPQTTQPSAPSDGSTAEPAAPGDDPTAAQPGASADDETASLELPPGSVEAKLLAEVQSPTAKGPSEWMTLDAATFATGSSEVVQDADAQLERVAKILEENPDVKLELGGFTSGAGSAAINRKLSQARANAVKAALVDKGIDASRLKAKGYGEKQPVEATDDDAEANRRVAMRIIDR